MKHYVLAIIWLIILAFCMILLGIHNIELHEKCNLLKQENIELKKRCERLCKDRSEVKRVLQNDTCNLAKYY